MPFFYTNDCKLYYTVQGQGTPLIFIHPPVLTHINFKYQMDELSKQFKVITFDIRGHGRSDFSCQSLTYPLIVEDIVRLLDFLGIEKAFICGYSTGGSIALEFLVEKPERSKGGIIISGLSEVNDWVTKNRILAGMGLAKIRAISTLAISIAWTNSKTKSLFWEMVVEARRGQAKNIEQYYRYALTYNCTRQLHKIDHPVLLLYGKKDRCFHQYAKLLHVRLPQNECKLIERISHQIPTLASKEMNDQIKQFINKCQDQNENEIIANYILNSEIKSENEYNDNLDCEWP